MDEDCGRWDDAAAEGVEVPAGPVEGWDGPGVSGCAGPPGVGGGVETEGVGGTMAEADRESGG